MLLPAARSTDAKRSSSDLDDWLTKSPGERLAATERLRQINFDYDPHTARIQRVFEVIDRE
jgi:hypothetical protein